MQRPATTACAPRRSPEAARGSAASALERTADPDYKRRQLAAKLSPPHMFYNIGGSGGAWRTPRGRTTMANTTSARKAARKILRRTEVNKTRRSRLRTFVGKVEDAIAS